MHSGTIAMTYSPAHYQLQDVQLIQQFLQQHYFALLMTADLQLTALPLDFHWDHANGLSGKIYAHLARNNPQLLALQQAQASQLAVKLVVQGPHAFVSAQCYQQQPQVSTWNYSLVEICGRVTLLDQGATLALVRRQQALEQQKCARQQLTRPQAEPSQMKAALQRYEKQLSAAIVGVEISIDQLQAKMKLSQNKTSTDRADVLRFLQQTEQPQLVWQLMQQQGLG